jgi:hypothetical protein
MDCKGLLMIVKVIIVLFLLSIFYALGSALYFLIRDKGDSDRIVKALTWRITLSLVLFLFLMVAFYFGWVTPNAVVGG